MAIITQTIDGQDFYVRSPLTTVTCNSVDYTVGVTMPLTNYTVGGEVDSATATEHFELIETARVNEAIIMSYTLPATDDDGNVLLSLTDNCPYLTAV